MNWRIHKTCRQNQEMVHTQYINASINISTETKHRPDIFFSTGDSDTMCHSGSYKSLYLFSSEIVNINLRLTSDYYLCKQTFSLRFLTFFYNMGIKKYSIYLWGLYTYCIKSLPKCVLQNYCPIKSNYHQMEGSAKNVYQ